MYTCVELLSHWVSLEIYAHEFQILTIFVLEKTTQIIQEQMYLLPSESKRNYGTRVKVIWALEYENFGFVYESPDIKLCVIIVTTSTNN
jgi:hypothetical protein